MFIRKIPKDDQSLLSASVYINSYKRAIEELVFNSLDAESNSIAIRVNIQENFIQVLDNGSGIAKHNFALLGNKYTSSKYVDITTLKSAPDKYGYRGMSLASIIEISKVVKISSKFHSSNKTWMKTFSNGKEVDFSVCITRPSRGTTVDICGFLHNLVIQNKSIDPLKELQYIKLGLEQLSLVHCNLSISLRDDSKNEIIFKVNKNRDIYQTLKSLFGIQQHDVQDLQVEKNQYKVRAFMVKHKDDVKKYQWIYLNGKIVFKTSIHKKIKNTLNNILNKKNYKNIKNKIHSDNFYKNNIPFYFIFISCPNFDFDIVYQHNKTFVEFKNWQEIDKLIEKLLKFYSGDTNLKPVNVYKGTTIAEVNDNGSTRKKVKEIIEKMLHKNAHKPKISQLKKGIKGKNVKRKRNVEISLHDVINKKNRNKLNNVIDLSKVIDPKGKITKEDHKNIQIMTNTKSKGIKDKIGDKSEKEMKTKHVGQNMTPQPIITKKKQKHASKNRYDENLHKSKRTKLNNSMKKAKQIVMHKKNKKKRKSNLLCDKDILGDNGIVKYARDFKTSYDLIKPVRDYVSPLMRKKQQFVFQQQTQSYITTCGTFKSKSTFNSHNYEQKFELKKNVMKEFISTNSRENFLLQERKLNSRHDKIKYKQNNKKISRNTLKIINKSAHISIYTNESNKTNESILCDNVNRAGVSNNFPNTVYNDKECKSKQNLKDNQYTNFSIDFNYANTYTIDILSGSLFTNNSKFSNTYSIHKYNYSANRTECQKSPVLLNEDDKNPSKNFSYRKDNIIISDSQTLEPLNFCETIYNTDNLDYVENEFNTSVMNEVVVEENLLCNNKNNDSLLNYGLIGDLKEYDFAFEEDFHKIESNFIEFIDQNINDQVMTNIEKKEDCINDKVQEKVIEDKIVTGSENMDHFKLKGRHSFVPKGMSQIFNNNNRKTLCLFDDQQEYYEDEIYENFAKNVFGNIKIYEPDVEDVKDTTTKHTKKASDKLNKENTDLIFDATSLKHATVLGQVDRKFIVAVVKGRSSNMSTYSNFLVLFDQHAVDERVRLESNLKDYYNGNEWKSVSMDSAIKLKLNKDDYLYLYNYKEKFNHFGLQWTFAQNEILIHAIPTAVLGKNIRDVDIVIKAVKTLILEQIEVIKMLKGNVSSYPKSIMNLVFSEACRYAIKFGDKLWKNDCVDMINALSECKTPFQCAHGRPVMAVLMELIDNKTKYTVNHNKIKKFKSLM